MSVLTHGNLAPELGAPTTTTRPTRMRALAGSW
jgi:hypothetical protein